ncbi:MAG: GyrI-like domain-containing protein [Methylobacter sp.]
MLETPQIVQTDEQLTAVIHLAVSRAEISHIMGPAIDELISTLTAQDARPAGPCFSFHWKRPSDVFDFEVGFPVDKPITPAGRVKMSKLPAAKIARTTYRGGYEGLASAWGEFCVWLESEGLNTQDSLWERYIVGPASTPALDQWRTELNRPLAE